MAHPGPLWNRHCIRPGNPILIQSLQFHANTSYIKNQVVIAFNVFRKRGNYERFVIFDSLKKGRPTEEATSLPGDPNFAVGIVQ